MKDNTHVVNFTDFCEDATFEEIKRALKFYKQDFVVEDVPKYFTNWELGDEDTKYRNGNYRHGSTLINYHSEGWQSFITVYDNHEYVFENDDACYYLPKTMSEFISDVLRQEDFELILSDIGRSAIYGN